MSLMCWGKRIPTERMGIAGALTSERAWCVSGRAGRPLKLEQSDQGGDGRRWDMEVTVAIN